MTKKMLCDKFGWNWPSGSGDEGENVKSLWQDWQRHTTDKFPLEKLSWAFGSGELKSCKENGGSLGIITVARNLETHNYTSFYKL